MERKYQPGTLSAIAYKKGVKAASDIVETTGDATQIVLSANRNVIKADQMDLSMIKVEAGDKNNLPVPTADQPISFSISGPGKIIGVGNGDQTSLEPDQYLETVKSFTIDDLKEKIVADWGNESDVREDANTLAWQKAFKDIRDEQFGQKVKVLVYRATFNLPDDKDKAAITLFYNSLGKSQSIYINGKEIAHQIPLNKKGDEFKLDAAMLHAGQNTIAIEATPILRENRWTSVNSNPGLIQLIYPAAQWKRNLFSGKAQVIIQSTGGEGEIVLTATSPGLKPQVIKIQAKSNPIN